MADKTWKAIERRFARAMGTERIPVTGERHGSDFTDTIACYQIKARRSLPSWLWGWMVGIQSTAAKQDKAGVLILKRPGDLDDEALVILSWKDWVDLHGSPKES